MTIHFIFLKHFHFLDYDGFTEKKGSPDLFAKWNMRKTRLTKHCQQAHNINLLYKVGPVTLQFRVRCDLFKYTYCRICYVSDFEGGMEVLHRKKHYLARQC